MTARLTASLLAFCIALPMCWCCAETAQTVPESGGCCSMNQAASCGHDTSQQQDGQEPHCPCLKHEDSRNMADVVVAMPAPDLKPLAGVTWQAADLTLAAGDYPVRNMALPDHGPPGGEPPHYRRHCALLI